MKDISCAYCKETFDTEPNYYSHYFTVHNSKSSSVKKILILGGGFGSVSVLRKIEEKFRDKEVEITVVSDENFFLFTPMLPQVTSGLLHPSSITMPIRYFCKKAKFLHAIVDSIDLEQQLVTIQRIFDNKVHALEYDFLVIGLGGTTNYFGNENLESHSFPMKTIEDAIAIRNHIILMLEQAAQTGNLELQRSLLTFTVVGSGFSGVETISEINEYVKRSVKKSYPSINPENINMILLSSKNRVLSEINEKLSSAATKYLEKNGITIMKNTKAIDADEESVVLDNGGKLSCATLIWTGGIKCNDVVSKLSRDHGKNGKLVVDSKLNLKDFSNVFALGDCALIKDRKLNSFYPSTAQHAIREGNLIAQNLNQLINGNYNLNNFTFSSMGNMAIIGNKFGIATIAGHNLSGFPAWILWRMYYLAKIPTFGKKLKIALDWMVDGLLLRDVTLIGTIKKKAIHSININENIPSIKEQLISQS